MCRVFEKYLADRQVCRVVEKHFVLVPIDIVKNPGGDKLYKQYGPQRGLPAWTIMDAGQKVLADSMKDKQNVGFPYEPHEKAHCLDVLRKSCPDLSAAELDKLKDRLDEHCRLLRAELEARKKPAGH